MDAIIGFPIQSAIVGFTSLGSPLLLLPTPPKEKTCSRGGYGATIHKTCYKMYIHMSRSSFHSNMNTIMMLLCYYLIIVSDFGEFYLKNKRPGTNIMRPTNTIKSLLSLLHQPVEQSNVPVG